MEIAAALDGTPSWIYQFTAFGPLINAVIVVVAFFFLRREIRKVEKAINDLPKHRYNVDPSSPLD